MVVVSADRSLALPSTRPRRALRNKVLKTSQFKTFCPTLACTIPSLSRWARSQRRDALFGKRNYESPRRVRRFLAPRARTLVAPHRRCAQRSCAIAPALSTHSARDEKTYRAAQRTYRVAGRSARYGAGRACARVLSPCCGYRCLCLTFAHGSLTVRTCHLLYAPRHFAIRIPIN